MSVVVAAVAVIALLVSGVVVYCISKQKRKENKRRSKRRQSEHREDHTKLSSGDSGGDNRRDGPVMAPREMKPMYHRQHGNTRFVPNNQSRRSQGLGDDTHALLRVRLEPSEVVVKRGLYSGRHDAEHSWKYTKAKYVWYPT